MFLKCGQKENTKYTFGLRKEQRDDIEVEKQAMNRTKSCSSCGSSCSQVSKYCQSCGASV